MSLQDLWLRAHPNSVIRCKYPTIDSLPTGFPDGHDDDIRSERELGDRFRSEILAVGSPQDSDDSKDLEASDQPDEIDDFLGQGGWHIEHTEKNHRGVARELWPAALAAEMTKGWARADRLIDGWARTAREKAFLLAVACGHTQGESRRLSGLNRPDHLLIRIRNMGYKLLKDEE